jgi:predicted ATPase
MIERVRIENFRTLRNVDVRLKPLTVLIGPNDTGKSSFLDAIYHSVTRRELPGRPYQEFARAPAQGQGLGTLVFDGVALFRLPAAGVAMRSRGAAEVQAKAATTLDWDGGNVPAVLDALYRRDLPRFERIVAALCQLISGIAKVRIYTPSAAERGIEVVLSDGSVLAGEEMSAGIRLLLFFLTLAHHPDPPTLVMIEEPENGLHPKRLGEVMRMLRGLTTGALGAPPVQVILTTHSPYLLDHVRLLPAEEPEDQVLVFRREADGSRSVTEADAQRLAPFLRDFMLGEVWYNQDEDGLVAKR